MIGHEGLEPHGQRVLRWLVCIRERKQLVQVHWLRGGGGEGEGRARGEGSGAAAPAPRRLPPPPPVGGGGRLSPQRTAGVW